MRRNIYGKMISAVMAMALCVTSVNVSAVQSESEITKKNALMSDKQEIIENNDKSIDDEGREKPVVIKEIKSMRDENSNTYLMSNGMKKTVYYSDNIRFEEDGKLKKYNSELVAAESQDKKIISLAKNISVKNSKKYKYVNKSGDTKQYLPETWAELMELQNRISQPFKPGRKNKKTGELIPGKTIHYFNELWDDLH